MQSFMLCLFSCSLVRYATALRVPATAAARPTPNPLQRRDVSIVTCDMNPTDGLPPFCLQQFSSMPLSGPSAPASTAAPAPTISCEQQNQDPDQGIEDQGCICTSGTVTTTLPILATGVMPSSSCGYTSFGQASGSVNLTPQFGPPVTNTVACQVCSPVANNGQSCTTLTSCLPDTATAVLQVGSSPVPLGTLTSAELSSSIASAVSSLCPTSGGSCDETQTVTISNILWIDDGVDQMDNGEVVVHVPASSWSDPKYLPGMIQIAVQSIVSSATGKNCKQVTWKVPDHAPGKRGLETNDTLGAVPSEEQLSKRVPVGGAAPQIQDGSATYCQCSDFAGPQYYPQGWREANPGPAAYLDVELGFQIAPTLFDEMFCDFVNELLETVELPAEPEAFGPLQLDDTAILGACQKGFGFFNGQSQNYLSKNG